MFILTHFYANPNNHHLDPKQECHYVLKTFMLFKSSSPKLISILTLKNFSSSRNGADQDGKTGEKCRSWGKTFQVESSGLKFGETQGFRLYIKISVWRKKIKIWGEKQWKWNYIWKKCKEIVVSGLFLDL